MMSESARSKSVQVLPRVTLVRGIGLDAKEMATFEPLLDRYALRAVGLNRYRNDMSATHVPCEWLRWKDELGGRSALNAFWSRFRSQRYYMPGLERRISGSALVHTTETSSTCSWQVVRARSRLKYRIVVTCVENIPHAVWDQPNMLERKAEVI